MGDELSLERIPFRDLPHELVLGLHKFGLAMIGIDRPAQLVKHQGSGTFVQFKGNCYILTAAHCATSIQAYKEMGLVIGQPEGKVTHDIPKPIYVAEERLLGPDLAFLPLDNNIVDYVLNNSDRVFYDLDTHRHNMLTEEPVIEHGLWGVVGSPEVLCDLNDPSRLVIDKRAYSVWVEGPTVDEGFDYIHVRVAKDNPDVLDYYSGISGGGLWQFDIGRLEDQSVVMTREPRLEGTVFIQLNPEDSDYLFFRCHSRKSIYDSAIAALEAAS